MPTQATEDIIRRGDRAIQEFRRLCANLRESLEQLEATQRELAEAQAASPHAPAGPTPKSRQESHS